MKVAFVTDPLETLHPAVDTSLGILGAALADGHDVWVTEVGALEAVDGRARAWARPVMTPMCPGGASQLGERGHVWLDDTDAVFMRANPPVDQDYLNATFVLDLVDPTRTALVNDPRGLRLCNEKLYALRFPDLVPPTIVAARTETILGFVRDHGRAVLKPIDGFAGHGVLILELTDPNLRSLLEISTLQGTRAVVVQRFLPEVACGNKRLFCLDGVPTAAVWRYPAGGDFRIGEPAADAPITLRDKEICARIAPSLRRDGLRMVGLDVIGDHLIEINVTSPGALHKTDVLLGTTLCADLLRSVLDTRNQLEPR